MKKFWLIVAAAFLLGCAPAALSPDFSLQNGGLLQVVGPENHALVLDGLS